MSNPRAVTPPKATSAEHSCPHHVAGFGVSVNSNKTRPSYILFHLPKCSAKRAPILEEIFAAIDDYVEEEFIPHHQCAPCYGVLSRLQHWRGNADDHKHAVVVLNFMLYHNLSV